MYLSDLNGAMILIFRKGDEIALIFPLSGRRLCPILWITTVMLCYVNCYATVMFVNDL